MNEQVAIDQAALATLLEMVGGDAVFLNEMIDEYFADTTRLLATMRHAIADENTVELRRAAHSLKGNSANFGAQRLEELCRDLEERGKQGTVSGADMLLAQIEAEYVRVQRALHDARPTGHTL